MTLTTDRKIELHRQQGYWPVPWAHHPQAIKEVFHRSGMRPTGKQCYRNAQQFVMYAFMLMERGTIEPMPVQYVEGIALGVFPFWHAWLRVGADDVDITLRDVTLTEHHHVVPTFELRDALVKNGHYQAVRPQEMHRHQLRAMGMADDQIESLIGGAP